MSRALAVVSLAVVACGKPTPQEECNKLSAAICNKLFSCDAAQAMQSFSSESDCTTKEEAALSCATTKPTCNIDDGALNSCLDDFKKQACTASGDPASCGADKLCPGQLVCSGEDVSEGSAGCTFTLTDCSDMHSYGLHCAMSNAPCDCQKDGVNTGTSFTPPASPCGSAKVSFGTGCGFPVGN